MIQLSIIIPTMDREAILAETLSCALNATEHIAAEIIVINDSKAGRPDLKKFESVRLIDNPKKGVASARNLGAAVAKSDLFLFLDDDIQINKDSIDQLLNLHRDHRDIAVNPNWVYPAELQQKLIKFSFGRFLIRYDLVNERGWYNNSRWEENSLFESSTLASFHLSISKSNFQKINGYNEIFPHAGFEDHDLPIRMRNSGMKLYLNTRSVVFHNEADRQDLESWLGRQMRGGQTRRVGVEIGYNELGIRYKLFKKALLSLMLIFKPVLVVVVNSIPNSRGWDFIYFRLVLTLQAICIFEGYHKS